MQSLWQDARGLQRRSNHRCRSCDHEGLLEFPVRLQGMRVSLECKAKSQEYGPGRRGGGLS